MRIQFILAAAFGAHMALLGGGDAYSDPRNSTGVVSVSDFVHLARGRESVDKGGRGRNAFGNRRGGDGQRAGGRRGGGEANRSGGRRNGNNPRVQSDEAAGAESFNGRRGGEGGGQRVGGRRGGDGGGQRYSGRRGDDGGRRYGGRRGGDRYVFRYNRHRHGKRYRSRRNGYRHFHLGWWYASPWWLASHYGYSDRCVYWEDRCDYWWGWRSWRFDRCMQEHGCW